MMYAPMHSRYRPADRPQVQPRTQESAPPVPMPQRPVVQAQAQPVPQRQQPYPQNGMRGPGPGGRMMPNRMNRGMPGPFQANRPVNGGGRQQGLLGKILNMKDPMGSLNKIMTVLRLLG